jgi:hypothetical protein
VSAQPNPSFLAVVRPRPGFQRRRKTKGEAKDAEGSRDEKSFLSFLRLLNSFCVFCVEGRWRGTLNAGVPGVTTSLRERAAEPGFPAASGNTAKSAKSPIARP